MAVWEGKLLIRSLQKHNMDDGGMPEPVSLVAMDSFKAMDSINSRTNEQGSINSGRVFSRGGSKGDGRGRPPPPR